MIINKDVYECSKCQEWYFFDTSKPFSKKCPICGEDLVFLLNDDCDTERVIPPPYDPTKDPKSPYYIPVITCPYCKSTDTQKISGLSKVGSVALFGIFSQKVKKQWHCNNCKSDF